jgi:hypothetical protein
LLLLFVQVADQFFRPVCVAQPHSHCSALFEHDCLQQFVEFDDSLSDDLGVKAADSEFFLALLVLFVPVDEVARNCVN